MLSWIEDTIQDKSRYADTDSNSNSDPEPSITTSYEPATTSSFSDEDYMWSGKPTSWENSSWRTVLEEDFVKDFGSNSMERGGTHARQYKKAFGKNGIARIQHGKGRKSSFTTMRIPNQRSSAHEDVRGKRTAEYKITMTFQGKGMTENEDRFCVQVQQDKKQWKDVRCYMSGKDFDNEVWITETLSYNVDDTTDDVKFRWMCEGKDRTDDVLFDYIKIECEA